jgi:hypothetical protein
MAAQFFDHSKAEDRLLSGVMKNMQPDQAGIEILVFD